MWLSRLTVPSSSTKPIMTKENFTKFLNEKQRDSRLNEELFPRLRQDQIKALIDKYEPCSTNSNRGEILFYGALTSLTMFLYFSFNPSMCISCSSAGLISPEGLLCFLMGPETSVVIQDRLAKCQDMTQPIPHYFIKSSHNTYLTGHIHHFDFSLQIFIPDYLYILKELIRTFPPQLVSFLVCPLRRCTVSVCCLAAGVWSWTAGRENLQMKSPSSPTASPWPLRSSSRWLHIVSGTSSEGFYKQVSHFTITFNIITIFFPLSYITYSFLNSGSCTM